MTLRLGRGEQMPLAAIGMADYVLGSATSAVSTNPVFRFARGWDVPSDTFGVALALVLARCCRVKNAAACTLYQRHGPQQFRRRIQAPAARCRLQAMASYAGQHGLHVLRHGVIATFHHCPGLRTALERQPGARRQAAG